MFRLPTALTRQVADVKRSFRFASLGVPLLGLLACGGGGGDATVTAPVVPGGGGPLPPVAATPEIPNNPQTWALLSGDLLINEGHPGRTVRVGNQFRTYFVRAADNTVVFATSTDVISSGPITPTNLQRVDVQGDLRAHLDHVAVMRRADGKYLMVYDYYPDPFITTCCAKQLVARISDDGITWGAGIPMPTSDIDNNPGTKKPFMSVATLLQFPNGSIRAYYTTAGTAVRSATTADGGATWTEDTGYRVVGIGQAFFGEPSAIMDSDGSVLLYVGYQNSGCSTPGDTNSFKIRMARSTDGLNFKVYTGSILNSSNALIDSDVFVGLDGKWRMVLGEQSICGQSGGTKPLLRVAERQ